MQVLLDKYLELGKGYFYYCESWWQSTLYSYFPRLINLSYFDMFILLNIVLIIIWLFISMIFKLQPKKYYQKIVKMFFKLPFMESKVSKQLQKLKQEVYNSIPDYGRSTLTKIPYNPPQKPISNNSQIASLKGFLSGSRYCNQNHSKFVISLAKEFAFSNPLHIDLHPFLKQMEIQVIKMTSKMLNFESEEGQSIGAFTSGGTQSIFSAILSYREYGIKNRGVKKPNFLVSVTGHVAALKACDYLQIEVRLVKQDKNYQMSISSMKSLIDENTIGVYISYPNYPYGTVDPIQQIASICKRKNLPLHVDMCLGGFLVPFLKNSKGDPMLVIPKGVTSISADPHKYGLSGKGASIVLFSDQKYLKAQFFSCGYWPGGLYATPGLAGSRSGVPIASAWVSMMKLGVEGYTKSAELVQNATLKFARELKKLGFTIYGKPQICVVAFQHNTFPVSSIQSEIGKRGWKLALNQKPLCLHFSFTPLNSQNVEGMIKAFQQVVVDLATKPLEKESKEVEFYGACAKIPDNSTKTLLCCTLLDSMIDV